MHCIAFMTIVFACTVFVHIYIHTQNTFMHDLENKVAYITGGSKGIGLGIAKKLIESGMRVAITSRHINEAIKAAQSLTNDESKILALNLMLLHLNRKHRQ